MVNGLYLNGFTYTVQCFIQSLQPVKTLYIQVVHPFTPHSYRACHFSLLEKCNNQNDTFTHHWPCHQEQPGVKYLAQGHIDMLTAGAGIEPSDWSHFLNKSQIIFHYFHYLGIYFVWQKIIPCLTFIFILNLKISVVIFVWYYHKKSKLQTIYTSGYTIYRTIILLVLCRIVHYITKSSRLGVRGSMSMSVK